MSARVISLQEHRAEKSARLREFIETEIEKFGEDFWAWFRLPAGDKAAIADDLAREISFRYHPIAQQLANGIYDYLVLELAAAEERGEDLAVATFRALGLFFQDLRYAKLAAHVERERMLANSDPAVAMAVRRSCSSPIDAARDDLFQHFRARRKK